MPIEAFIEDKISKYAALIAKQGERGDEFAFGELTFYMALRRVRAGTGTTQDLGLMDAINDTLQQLGHITNNVSFYK